MALPNCSVCVNTCCSGCPEQIFRAHVEQMFRSRIKVSNAQLFIQQDDRGGEIFECQIWEFGHTFLQSRKHARYRYYLSLDNSVLSASIFFWCKSTCSASVLSFFLVSCRVGGLQVLAGLIKQPAFCVQFILQNLAARVIAASLSCAVTLGKSSGVVRARAGGAMVGSAQE